MPTIIQFMHPFLEATPRDPLHNYIGWNNSNKHRRKFLVSKGNYIDTNDSEINSELTFWAEWEPQSRIRKIESVDLKPPNFLNFPYIDQSVLDKKQTTDPYIFGDCFRYFICLQDQFINILKRLEPSSIILFGSNIKSRFCLDTVFVVSDESITYNIRDAKAKLCSGLKNTFYCAGIVPLLLDNIEHCAPNVGFNTYTFYKGVTFKKRDRFNGTFSFVPSKIYNSKSPAFSSFQLPSINLDFINHNQVRGIKSKLCSVTELEFYWNEIKSQIHKQHLLIGNKFSSPKLEK